MKLSIITTSYNSALTIRSTIESVLAQSYPNFEHIIIDGASKDGTMDIVREYEPRYNGKLKYISEKDKGIYDAMNKGIQMASGDIVGTLNSDDFFSSPEVLSTLAREFKDVDAVYADVQYVDEKNISNCVRYYSSKFFKKNYMLMGYQPAHPTFYCKKDLYNRLGLFDINFRIAADFELMFRFIYVNKIKTKYIEGNLVTMRTGGASSSGINSHIQILKDHMRVYKKYGIINGYVFDLLRYPLKIGEVVLSKTKLKKYLAHQRPSNKSDSSLKEEGSDE